MGPKKLLSWTKKLITKKYQLLVPFVADVLVKGMFCFLQFTHTYGMLKSCLYLYRNGIGAFDHMQPLR